MDDRAISVIIVHYRTPDETLQSARAVTRTAPSAELLVVDNASRDGIEERLEREVPGARALIEPENRGYGAACNRGARESRGEYLLFLNSDAFVQPGCVETLVRALESDPEAAVAGPRLVNADGTLQASIQRPPTPWRIFCESSGLAALAGGRGIFSGHTKTREDHARARPVEALLGAALLIRRSAFEQVGGFDESFFLYAEETDLMARLAARGRRILYEPGARAVHLGGSSGGDRMFGELLVSLRHYVRKHHGRTAAAFAGLALTAGAVARYGAALVTPGEFGRKRRARYRAALSARSR